MKFQSHDAGPTGVQVLVIVLLCMAVAVPFIWYLQERDRQAALNRERVVTACNERGGVYTSFGCQKVKRLPTVEYLR